VLVVDDEPSVIDVFQEFLSGQAMRCRSPRTAMEAVRLIPELRPDIIPPTSTCRDSRVSR